MIKVILLTIISSLYFSFALASLQLVNKEESKLIAELDAQGFKLGNSELIVLNENAQKNNVPIDGLYRLSFICKHQKKKDNCKISSLVLKPQEQSPKDSVK